jgi:hypothetical protein
MASSGEKTALVRHCNRTNADITLCYETFGDARNEPLLFIMGLNSQMVSW